MANAPAYILGVVNVLGVIVPIIDMRIKFNLAKVDYGVCTVVVDGVSDVITLTSEQLRPAPDFSSEIGSNHATAIGSQEKRMLILLDIETLMSDTDMGLTSKTIPQ